MTSLPDESIDLSSSIVKSDRIGRANYSHEYREKVLAAFDKSAMSGPAFARQCGVKYPTFASWVSKRRKDNNAQPLDSNGPFILAEFQQPSPSEAGLQIQLTSQATVTLTSSEHVPILAALIKALA